MAANILFNYDTSEMRKMNRWFHEKDWNKIKKRALNKAGGTIKKEVKKLFKTVLPAANFKNPNYIDKLIDAVRSSKVKESGIAELSLKVHIMGTRKKGSRTYLARFFEQGTKERFIKPGYTDKLGRKYTKARSIGHIEPLWFFRDSMGSQNVAGMKMNSYLESEINKINNKKFS